MPDAARLAFLAEEYREAVSTDASVQTKHLLAPQLTFETGLISETDAAAEASRIQTLRGTQRRRFEFTAPMTASTLALDIGDVITLVNPRFGLSSGEKFVILGIDPDGGKRTITFNVWG